MRSSVAFALSHRGHLRRERRAVPCPTDGRHLADEAGKNKVADPPPPELPLNCVAGVVANFTDTMVYW
jgi:hypothetical protein